MSQPNLAYAGEVLKIVKITDSSYKFWNICPVVYIVSSDHWEMLGLYNGQRFFFTLFVILCWVCSFSVDLVFLYNHQVTCTVWWPFLIRRKTMIYRQAPLWGPCAVAWAGALKAAGLSMRPCERKVEREERRLRNKNLIDWVRSRWTDMTLLLSP